MSEKKELCESFEMCVLSEKELSENLKEHAKVCENCRKFLEQYKILDEDLKGFSIDGVDYEKISASVMNEIRKEKKTGVRFRFSHHIGTAAAVVIILAAALIYGKNPGSLDESKAVYDVAVTGSEAQEKTELFSDTQIISERKMSKQNEDAEHDEESEKEAEITESATTYTATADLENGFSVYNEETTENAALDHDIDGEGVGDTKKSLRGVTVDNNITLSTYKMSADSGRAVRDSDEPQNEAVAEIADADESLDSSAAEDFDDDNAESVTVEQAEEIESEGFLTSSRGGGGGSSSSVENEINAVSEADKYDENFHVFDGLDFLTGEENTDYNLLLANDRLSELYGEETFKLDLNCLAFNGLDKIELFFANAHSLTYSDIKQICEEAKTQK